jgi:CRP-like cAMP-binding protein
MSMPANSNVVRVTPGDLPRQNQLLAALGDAEYLRLVPHLQLVHLPLGRVLCEADGHLDHAWFPTTCLLSTLCDLENGTSVDIAVTGNEGVVGTSLYLGGRCQAARIVVRGAGHAYRLRADVLKREFERGGILQSLLLRYTQALYTQTARTAVCNACHPIDAQLCRSLLFSLDRLSTNELETTHEAIADTLGVRRESVTAAAGKLQAAGAIRCSRGRITVLDRALLESRVCECYAAVKAQFARVAPPRTAEIRYLLQRNAPATGALTAQKDR